MLAEFPELRHKLSSDSLLMMDINTPNYDQCNIFLFIIIYFFLQYERLRSYEQIQRLRLGSGLRVRA